MARYEIRAARRDDQAEVHVLARYLNTVNLPDDRAAIAHLLDVSERSFSGAIRDPREREYVFVLRDQQEQCAVATSMIIGQLGRPGMPYIYLDVDREERYSSTLERHFVHQVLTTRYSYDGPTEIGGLVVHPARRAGPDRLGTAISFVRFLFIAMRRGDYRDELLAELLPPLEPDGTSHLWEAFGRHFTGLSYLEADRLSKRNKEFIKGLFPQGEVYVSLLPEKAQAVIGRVGAQTLGVEKMLRRIGFRYAECVDPFDGGPHFTCPTREVSLIREARPVTLRVGDEAGLPMDTSMLVGHRSAVAPYFVAHVTPAALVSASELAVPRPLFERFSTLPHGETWALPLPTSRGSGP